MNNYLCVNLVFADFNRIKITNWNYWNYIYRQYIFDEVE